MIKSYSNGDKHEYLNRELRVPLGRVLFNAKSMTFQTIFFKTKGFFSKAKYKNNIISKPKWNFGINGTSYEIRTNLPTLGFFAFQDTKNQVCSAPASFRTCSIIKSMEVLQLTYLPRSWASHDHHSF
jgi:hypothetical protein